MFDYSDLKDSQKVFKYFEEISKIPHGSGNTDKIADYLVSFATERALYVRRDEANNVIIKKAATPGYEDRPGVIIQGHTDMVEAVKPGYKKDLKTEALDLVREGDILRAEGTTLGADDGIAVAYALALLDSDDIAHPALEIILTSDEEIGLIGAGALDPYDIDARLLINIDTDNEGVFTAGCAGGVRVDVEVPMRVTKSEGEFKKIKVCGMRGGHSGVEIKHGRENAIHALFDLIKSSSATAATGFVGGNADNAIPRSAECIASFEDEGKLDEAIKSTYAKYSVCEPDVVITKEDCDTPDTAFDKPTLDNLTTLVTSLPNGVQKMSEDIAGLVETSLNLGLLESKEDKVTLALSLRSAKDAEKDALATRVIKIAEDHGAATRSHGSYPGWAFRRDSHLREVMCKVYEDMFGTSAKVITIHAGLECGIFSGKIPDLDCIAMGPNIHDIHTTEEHLSLSSVDRMWKFLKEVLKNV